MAVGKYSLKRCSRADRAAEQNGIYSRPVLSGRLSIPLEKVIENVYPHGTLLRSRVEPSTSL